MEIKILKKEYLKSEQIYKDFLENKIETNLDNFEGETANIKFTEDFPFYLHVKEEEREALYLEGFKVISKIISETDRKVHFEAEFWYSYLLTKKRGYILENYKEVLQSEKEFRNIILKKFDWENYIYKLILGAQYVTDNISDEKEQEHYFRLIANNLDVYNYILKNEIFKNDKFLLNVLDIIDRNKVSEHCKRKIQFYKKQGKDERVGRRVLFEFNKSYPMILSPTMSVDELEVIFMENLNKYLRLDEKYMDDSKKMVSETEINEIKISNESSENNINKGNFLLSFFKQQSK